MGIFEKQLFKPLQRHTKFLVFNWHPTQLYYMHTMLTVISISMCGVQCQNPILNLLFIAGEDIWRFVGKLSSAQKGVMDEKFKWTVSSTFCHFTISLVLNYNIAHTKTVIAKVECHWLKFLFLPINVLLRLLKGLILFS
jgi:hypothetical protein